MTLSKSTHAHHNKQGERSLFTADIRNFGSGEHARYVVGAAGDDGLLDARCVPSDADRPDETDPDSFSSNPRSVALNLTSMFGESKVRLASHFLRTISQDTREKYSSWMDKNEKTLDSLTGLGVPLPDYVAAPIAYVLTAQWNTTINEIEIYGREDDVWIKLLDLWRKTQACGITLDYSESARLLFDLLMAELKIFEATLSEVSVGRMRYLLNIVDRFAIPFSKNKAEDLFFSIMGKTLVPMYDEFKKSHSATHRDTIIRLVQVARRMNFNTDSFPVL